MKWASFFLSALFFYSFLHAKIIENNRINPLILKIFTLYSTTYTPEEQTTLEYLNPYDIVPSISFLNNLGQKYFLRPAHLSRLQPAELTEYYSNTLFKGCTSEEIETKRATTYQLFKKSGYVQEVFPPSTYTPDVVLILGATIMCMFNRIAFFNKYVEEKKITISNKTKIILCIGDRTLMDYEKKDLDTLSQTYRCPLSPDINNEIEGGAALLTFFPFTSSLHSADIAFIAAQKQPGNPRATTMDTIEEVFNKISVENKNILIVSNNPYVEYQTSIAELSFIQKHKPFNAIKGMGYKFNADTNSFNLKDIGIFLDNIARTFYTLNKIYEVAPFSDSWLKYAYKIKIILKKLFNRSFLTLYQPTI